jgi:hypothetical protein
MRYKYKLRKDLEKVIEQHLKNGTTNKHRILQTLINMHEYHSLNHRIKQKENK